MRNSTTPQPTRQTISDILLDACAIYRAGRWSEAQERCRAALQDYHEQVRQRAIGATLTIDLLAGDVAELVGIERAIVRHVARDVLLDSPAQAVRRELAAMRRERRAGR